MSLCDEVLNRVGSGTKFSSQKVSRLNDIGGTGAPYSFLLGDLSFCQIQSPYQPGLGTSTRVNCFFRHSKAPTVRAKPRNPKFVVRWGRTGTNFWVETSRWLERIPHG